MGGGGGGGGGDHYCTYAKVLKCLKDLSRYIYIG